MTNLSLHFPKQSKDFKIISRDIRFNPLFKEFVTNKSKDRRYLHLDFSTKEKYDILKPILLGVIETSGYVARDVTEETA